MKIRPALVSDADGIARMHVESWRSSYKGIISEDYLASISETGRADRWRENLSAQNPKTCIFVAEDTNRHIVGVASGGSQRDPNLDYDGELYAIYLLEMVQGRGLGSRLLYAVKNHLVTNGYKSMLVWVLEDNPSRKFYEALGGKYVSQKTITIGNQELIEFAYGWRDLRNLVKTNAQ